MRKEKDPDPDILWERSFQQKQMKMFRHLLEYHNVEREPISST